jgi:hypothetical protein
LDPHVLGVVLLGGSMFAEGFLLCMWLLFEGVWIGQRGYWGS